MLTQSSKTSSSASVIPDKQICVQAPSNGSIMYEVPTGRKFVGIFAVSSNNQIYVNGVNITSSASATPPYIPIVLLAGSKVTSGTSYTGWSLLGVETNA